MEIGEWERDEGQARMEEAQAGSLNCFTREQLDKMGAPLCGAWQVEDAGWTRVEVVMDSGAAESVCPRDMCPQFPIQDSAASLAGVFYTAANGGKIANLGEQRIPVSFGGVRTSAVFQVAEVSRPLMSVARICEVGN